MTSHYIGDVTTLISFQTEYDSTAIFEHSAPHRLGHSF